MTECDHSRSVPRGSTALTFCCCCRDYLCSICGITIAWYEGLRVTNPPVQWCYCVKDGCIEAEAKYHGMPVDEMISHRGTLRAKRVLTHLQDRGIKPRPRYAPALQDAGSGPQSITSRPERINIVPRAFTLDLGEACWCNCGKDCDGSHEIYLGEPVHRCGFCGQTFEIKSTDPHWSTGRGPICPTESK